MSSSSTGQPLAIICTLMRGHCWLVSQYHLARKHCILNDYELARDFFLFLLLYQDAVWKHVLLEEEDRLTQHSTVQLPIHLPWGGCLVFSTNGPWGGNTFLLNLGSYQCHFGHSMEQIEPLDPLLIWKIVQNTGSRILRYIGASYRLPSPLKHLPRCRAVMQCVGCAFLWGSS